MSSPGAPAALLLSKQYKLIQSDDSIEGISVGLVDSNVFEWEVMLMISDECKFYGGKKSSPKSIFCSVDINSRLTPGLINRRLLPLSTLVPTRVPSPPSENEIRDPDFPPKYLSQWRRVYFHSTPTRRGFDRVREHGGAVESRSDTGDYFTERD